jgi:hypothetical protein
MIAHLECYYPWRPAPQRPLSTIQSGNRMRGMARARRGIRDHVGLSSRPCNAGIASSHGDSFVPLNTVRRTTEQPAREIEERESAGRGLAIFDTWAVGLCRGRTGNEISSRTSSATALERVGARLRPQPFRAPAPTRLCRAADSRPKRLLQRVYLEFTSGG